MIPDGNNVFMYLNKGLCLCVTAYVWHPQASPTHAVMSHKFYKMDLMLFQTPVSYTLWK